MLSLSLNKISLIRNPLLLHSDDLILKLLSLLENIILLGLHWPRVLINSSIFELRPDSVELVNSELSLVNSVVSLFDVLFKFFNLVFLFFQLSN
jgi:hypothetical protein